MSYTIDATFTCPEADIEQWEEFIAVLDSDIGGANLQEVVEWWGEGAASQLEKMLEDDELGPEAFNLEDSAVEGDKIALMFECGNDDFADQLELLLKRCRAKGLKVELS